MTKLVLVTGIEAIQSGRPFRFHYEEYTGTTCWRKPNETLDVFTAEKLLKQRFEIKQEPREFWIPIESTFKNPGSAQSKEWIKVREVIE